MVFHIPSRFLKRCVLGCVADYNRCVYSAMSTISGDDQEFVEIREGKAKILFPKENDVFYNPVQQLNRDLRYCFIHRTMCRTVDIMYMLINKLLYLMFFFWFL